MIKRRGILALFKDRRMSTWLSGAHRRNYSRCPKLKLEQWDVVTDRSMTSHVQNIQLDGCLWPKLEVMFIISVSPHSVRRLVLAGCNKMYYNISVRSFNYRFWSGKLSFNLAIRWNKIPSQLTIDCLFFSRLVQVTHTMVNF